MTISFINSSKIFFKIITHVLKQKLEAITYSHLKYNVKLYWPWKYTKKVFISFGWTVTIKFSEVSVLLKNPVKHKNVGNLFKKQLYSNVHIILPQQF